MWRSLAWIGAACLVAALWLQASAQTKEGEAPAKENPSAPREAADSKPGDAKDKKPDGEPQRYDGSGELDPAQVALQEGKFIENIRQLTNEGQSGEGYFSPDGKRVIFQAIRGEHPFYQIYIKDLASGQEKRVSTGQGRTTCAFFHPTENKIIYASSHLDPNRDKEVDAELKKLAEARRNPGARRGYSWAFDPFMDIFELNLDTNELKQLTSVAGYDGATQDSTGFPIIMNSTEAAEIAIENRSVDIAQRLRDRADVVTRRFRIFFIKSHMSNFRVGVGTPRNHQIADFSTREEQRIGDDDARHGIGGVGEFVSGTHIARSINSWIAGAKPLVDGHPLRGVTHSRFVKSQPFQVRLSPPTDENLIDDEIVMVSRLPSPPAFVIFKSLPQHISCTPSSSMIDLRTISLASGSSLGMMP